MTEEKYELPEDESIVVDVGQGKIVDEKELSHWERLKLAAQKANIPIKEPKEDCRHCYGRGYTGFDKEIPIACKCIFSKEDLEANKGQMFLNRSRIRRIEKIKHLDHKEVFNRKLKEMGLVRVDKDLYKNKNNKFFKWEESKKNFILFLKGNKND